MAGFAKTMGRRRDNRNNATLLRHVQRMASGEVRISGEMPVIMAIFRSNNRKRKAAAKTGDQALSAAT